MNIALVQVGIGDSKILRWESIGGGGGGGGGFLRGRGGGWVWGWGGVFFLGGGRGGGLRGGWAGLLLRRTRVSLRP